MLLVKTQLVVNYSYSGFFFKGMTDGNRSVTGESGLLMLHLRMKESVLDNGTLELPGAGPEAKSPRIIFPPNPIILFVTSDIHHFQVSKNIFNKLK